MASSGMKLTWSPKSNVALHAATTDIPGAKALALEAKIGRIVEGGLADIAVFAGDRTQPYDAVLAAKPKDVRLVMVGVVPLYGDKVLEPATSGVPPCEGLDVCGASKFVCVATISNTSKLDQTYASIKSTP